LDQRTIEALGLNADDFRQKSQTGSDSGKIIEPSVGATGASESNSGIR
jgi:hypothetical protein